MRTALVVLHRWIGLASAAVLVVLAITGGILALAPDYDAWADPSPRHVTPQATHVSAQRSLESALARAVPSHVTEVDVGGPGQPWAFRTGAGMVFVDPYTGAVIGTRTGPTAMNRAVVYWAHRLHTGLGGFRIGGVEAGQLAVDYASVATVCLLLSGIVLWWKKKRFVFHRTARWRVLNWDLHSAVGIWAFAALLILATSGVFIAFPRLLFEITHSAPAATSPMPLSAAMDAGGTVRCATGGSASPTLDDVLAAADRAVPDLTTVAVEFPRGKRAPYRVTKRPTGGLGALSTIVAVDRYCGTVAAVDRSAAESRGFGIYSWNLAIHDGSAWNGAGRAVLGGSSLLLGVLSCTGILMWAARARPFTRSRVQSLSRSLNRSLSS